MSDVIMESVGKDQTYFQKVLGILTRPKMTLATMQLKQSESIIIVVVLYVLVIIKGLAELIHIQEQNRIGWLIIGSAFGLMLAWFSLTTLFHLIAKIFDGGGSYWNTLLLMGYIATPMVITSFISLVIYIISLFLKPDWGGVEWDVAQTVIEWIGMIWGWPGILCYFVLRYGESLSSRRAGIVVGIIMLVTIFGWFVPVIIPGWFG
jgi:hypothetical protein